MGGKKGKKSVPGQMGSQRLEGTQAPGMMGTQKAGAAQPLMNPASGKPAQSQVLSQMAGKRSKMASKQRAQMASARKAGKAQAQNNQAQAQNNQMDTQRAADANATQFNFHQILEGTTVNKGKPGSLRKGEARKVDSPNEAGAAAPDPWPTGEVAIDMVKTSPNNQLRLGLPGPCDEVVIDMGGDSSGENTEDADGDKNKKKGGGAGCDSDQNSKDATKSIKSEAGTKKSKESKSDSTKNLKVVGASIICLVCVAIVGGVGLVLYNTNIMGNGASEKRESNEGASTVTKPAPSGSTPPRPPKPGKPGGVATPPTPTGADGPEVTLTIGERTAKIMMNGKEKISWGDIKKQLQSAEGRDKKILGGEKDQFKFNANELKEVFFDGKKVEDNQEFTKEQILEAEKWKLDSRSTKTSSHFNENFTANVKGGNSEELTPEAEVKETGKVSSALEEIIGPKGNQPELKLKELESKFESNYNTNLNNYNNMGGLQGNTTKLPEFSTWDKISSEAIDKAQEFTEKDKDKKEVSDLLTRLDTVLTKEYYGGDDLPLKSTLESGVVKLVLFEKLLEDLLKMEIEKRKVLVNAILPDGEGEEKSVDFQLFKFDLGPGDGIVPFEFGKDALPKFSSDKVRSCDELKKALITLGGDADILLQPAAPKAGLRFEDVYEEANGGALVSGQEYLWTKTSSLLTVTFQISAALTAADQKPLYFLMSKAPSGSPAGALATGPKVSHVKTKILEVKNVKNLLQNGNDSEFGFFDNGRVLESDATINTNAISLLLFSETWTVTKYGSDKSLRLPIDMKLTCGELLDLLFRGVNLGGGLEFGGGITKEHVKVYRDLITYEVLNPDETISTYQEVKDLYVVEEKNTLPVHYLTTDSEEDNSKFKLIPFGTSVGKTETVIGDLVNMWASSCKLPWNDESYSIYPGQLRREDVTLDKLLLDTTLVKCNLKAEEIGSRDAFTIFYSGRMEQVSLEDASFETPSVITHKYNMGMNIDGILATLRTKYLITGQVLMQWTTKKSDLNCRLWRDPAGVEDGELAHDHTKGIRYVKITQETKPKTRIVEYGPGSDPIKIYDIPFSGEFSNLGGNIVTDKGELRNLEEVHIQGRFKTEGDEWVRCKRSVLGQYGALLGDEIVWARVSGSDESKYLKPVLKTIVDGVKKSSLPYDPAMEIRDLKTALSLSPHVGLTLSKINGVEIQTGGIQVSNPLEDGTKIEDLLPDNDDPLTLEFNSYFPPPSPSEPELSSEPASSGVTPTELHIAGLYTASPLSINHDFDNDKSKLTWKEIVGMITQNHPETEEKLKSGVYYNKHPTRLNDLTKFGREQIADPNAWDLTKMYKIEVGLKVHPVSSAVDMSWKELLDKDSGLKGLFEEDLKENTEWWYRTNTEPDNFKEERVDLKGTFKARSDERVTIKRAQVIEMKMLGAKTTPIKLDKDAEKIPWEEIEEQLISEGRWDHEDVKKVWFINPTSKDLLKPGGRTFTQYEIRDETKWVLESEKILILKVRRKTPITFDESSDSISWANMREQLLKKGWKEEDVEKLRFQEQNPEGRTFKKEEIRDEKNWALEESLQVTLGKTSTPITVYESSESSGISWVDMREQLLKKGWKEEDVKKVRFQKQNPEGRTFKKEEIGDEKNWALASKEILEVMGKKTPITFYESSKSSDSISWVDMKAQLLNRRGWQEEDVKKLRFKKHNPEGRTFQKLETQRGKLISYPMQKSFTKDDIGTKIHWGEADEVDLLVEEYYYGLAGRKEALVQKFEETFERYTKRSLRAFHKSKKSLPVAFSKCQWRRVTMEAIDTSDVFTASDKGPDKKKVSTLHFRLTEELLKHYDDMEWGEFGVEVDKLVLYEELLNSYSNLNPQKTEVLVKAILPKKTRCTQCGQWC